MLDQIAQHGQGFVSEADHFLSAPQLFILRIQPKRPKIQAVALLHALFSARLRNIS
jgi:hypothetical protein